MAAIIALVLVGVATAAVRMSGYGATSKAWAAHHRADPNPKLFKGCCYLPQQADGTDRYYSVQRNGKGRVYAYSMHFAPKVSATFVSFLLRREAPVPTGRRQVASWTLTSSIIPPVLQNRGSPMGDWAMNL